MSTGRMLLVLAMGVTVVLLGVACARARPNAPTAYYLSPDGDDQGLGTPSQPWRSLKYALQQVEAGDVLYLRGGTYYEAGLEVRLRATAAAPVTVRSYPGERAVISGSQRRAPTWEPVDPRVNLYRSAETYAGKFAGAWLTDAGIQLVQYDKLENLKSTNYGPVSGRTPFYAGPGVHLAADGHVYIRLEPNPNDLTGPDGRPISPVPADSDPNHNRVEIFTSEYLFLLDHASYVRFMDLTFANAWTIMDVRYSEHIQLENCLLYFGTYGLVLRENVHDLYIHRNEFTNGLPEYVYWTDVKNSEREVAEAYPEFQSAGIIGRMIRTIVSHNTFRNSFDGVDIDAGSMDTRIIGNEFHHVLDDAVEVNLAVSNVEVGYNFLWRVGSGVSLVASGGRPGPVYIHHNIIDNSMYQRGGRPGNYRAADWPVWTTIDPFSSHESGSRTAWWRVYNNTVVTRQGGYRWNAAGPAVVAGNPEKYVYNNIFYILDGRVVFRDDLVADGSHYDGNVIYRPNPTDLPLFYHFGDGKDYRSLAEFQRGAAVGWERAGLEIDPGFRLRTVPEAHREPQGMWEAYRPSDSRIFTAGASYAGLDWPGTEGVAYRGALPPSGPWP